MKINLRSTFWDSRATKAGDAFAAKNSLALALEKPGLKSSSDFGKEIPMQKPALPNNFSLGLKGFKKFLRLLCFFNFHELGFR